MAKNLEYEGPYFFQMPVNRTSCPIRRHLHRHRCIRAQGTSGSDFNSVAIDLADLADCDARALQFRPQTVSECCYELFACCIDTEKWHPNQTEARTHIEYGTAARSTILGSTDRVNAVNPIMLTLITHQYATRRFREKHRFGQVRRC